MSFDGIVTNALVKEFKETITGGRIDKIYQQEKDEILIHIRNLGNNYKLLLSASSNNPRAYLTDYSKQNPNTPPMFCMFLRKQLQGGIILDINQHELDRIITIDVKSLDEIGDISTKQLIIEIMGKHSNIILIDKSSEIILDSIKRVPESISRVRQVLPGLKYQYPPSNDKLNPLHIDFDTFLNKLDKNNKNVQVFKFLYKSFIGLSPLISKEICYRAHIDERLTINALTKLDVKNLYSSFNSLMNDVLEKNFNPHFIKNDKTNEILAFHALNLSQYECMYKISNQSISAILDNYYHKKDTIDRIKQKSLSIRRTIQTKLERDLNKLAKQKQELLDSKKREKYKIYGDLISANIYKIDRGIDSIDLENFYTENLDLINIPLDPKLSPSQNAQKYYKKYTKLKNASKLLEKEIPKTEDEIEYLENILVSIENCTEIEELDEIKEELINEGYLKGKNRKKKKNKKQNSSKPYHFISSDGFHIYVGKNNKQNDYLTLRFANKEDIWLHTKDIPGSHVIIRKENMEVPQNTLYEAAILSAFYSKSKNSENVAVDYTEKKHVKKPNGAKPGMVIYEQNSTIYVTPKIEEISKIKKAEV